MTQASVDFDVGKKTLDKSKTLHIGIEYSQILAAKGQKKWYE